VARSGPRAGRNGRRDAVPPRSEADRIIDAAFARIVEDGWRRLSLAAVAAEAGVPILIAYRAFGSKQAVLCRFVDRIDATVLADPPTAEAGEHPRDRVFDLLMRRFDALRPYKRAFAALRRDLPSDPLAALCLAARLSRSMRWMLDAADIATGGLSGAVAVRLAGTAYLSAMRVWQRDDSTDLAATMAALDSRLRRIETWLRPLRPPRRSGETAAA
jgi:AcrR family transcriptional regulator